MRNLSFLGCVLSFVLMLFPDARAMAASKSAAALMEAVRAGDNRAVTVLLRDGADVNVTTPDGTTPLHWAAHRDDLDLVDRLLRAGAKVNAKNRYGVAPISLAAVNANPDVLKRLLLAGADPSVTMGGETPLMTASRAGGEAALKLLAAHGAKLDATTGPDSGITALMLAAASNNTAAIKALVELGADLRAKTTNPAIDNGGFGTRSGNDPQIVLDQFKRRREGDSPREPRQFTAFLFAARAGHIDAMKALLAAGANVNDTLAGGMTALTLAVTSNQLDAASFLLDNGADPNSAANGWNALHQLVFTRRPNRGLNQLGPISRDRIDSLDLAKKLVAHGADVNARMTQPMSTLYTGRTALNYAGNTPFLLAAHRVDLDYMRVLVAAGADPLLANDDKTTPLMAAAGCSLASPGENPGSFKEADDAVKFILSFGPDPNVVDAYGDTALHGAAYRGASGAVEALVAAGAKLDAKNMLTKKGRSKAILSVGWTPLMVADGIFQNGTYKQQPETAAVLRRLMQAQGISTTYELEGRQAEEVASAEPGQ